VINKKYKCLKAINDVELTANSSQFSCRHSVRGTVLEVSISDFRWRNTQDQ